MSYRVSAREKVANYCPWGVESGGGARERVEGLQLRLKVAGGEPWGRQARSLMGS